MGDNEFGDKLRELRVSAGLSLRDLARCVNFTPSYLSKIETGKKRPHRALASACDKALDTGNALADLVPEDNGEPGSARPLALCTLAICGSRSVGTDAAVIDAAVRELARFVMLTGCKVNHGPVGVGIEVMTYIADHYRLPDLTMAIGLFGRANVVRGVGYVLVIGGGSGTADEIDLALYGGVTVIPFPASGGTAAVFYERARREPELQARIPEQLFEALGCCGAEEFVKIVRQVLDYDEGVT
ncbi:MAG: helix-turn-helix domain-containing protein [Pseudonocardiaceae bacterium]